MHGWKIHSKCKKTDGFYYNRLLRVNDIVLDTTWKPPFQELPCVKSGWSIKEYPVKFKKKKLWQYTYIFQLHGYVGLDFLQILQLNPMILKIE